MREKHFLQRCLKLSRKIGWESLAIVHRSDRARVTTLHERTLTDIRGGEEFVRRYDGKAYIEPEHGYVITDGGLLIESALVPSYYPTNPWRHVMPCPFKFFRAKKTPGRVIHRPEVIHLRSLWEWNLWHFYADVLGNLNLLEELGVDKNTPIVLGPYAGELSFVKQILSSGALAGREWIIPTDQYVCADRVYYVRQSQPYNKSLGYIVRQIGVPPPAADTDRRVFLYRPVTGSRHIINQVEVEALLARRGFRGVDASKMTIADQIEMLSNTRYLFAVHGAGITNIMYRMGRPLSLVELHPSNYMTESYMDMCRQMGFSYNTLPGAPEGGTAQNTNFTVDVGALEAKIDAMLAGDLEGRIEGPLVSRLPPT